MGNIFYIMGKSSSGKDTIYENLLARESLHLHPLIMYTTRSIRTGETDGVQYHFVTEAQLEEMQQAGTVIELRTYQTVYGPWYYFTADSPEVSDADVNYLALGTLESFQKIREYYGKEKVYPIYIQVEDELRLLRAIKREKKQEHPNFKEVCRRYLADEEDFSEEKLQAVEITRRFLNNADREICMDEVASYIATILEK